MAMPRLEDLPVPQKELVSYLASHPDVPMTEVMEPYRHYEAQLRSVFAQDRSNPALADPHINVLPLFTQDTKLITTRARQLDAESQEEKDRYIMALPDDKRRPHGSPAVVQSVKEFQKNFNVFSESSMIDMDWSNVVAAGSSVVNCLLPVPAEFNTTKRKLREYYHEKFCPASDVDLFLYGITHDEAIEKIKDIERSIKDAILTEVTVVRTKYAITIASQYPTRHVQVVLRVYKSIGEILTGFDIDAAGGAYDGKQVYVTPRALGSFITQINHIDLTRRSPSYENRLSKYSHRDFEVYWPELDRSRVDPTIFERSFGRTLGLARLLVLERLPTSSARDTYMNKRRQERGRPTVYMNHYRRLGGNIKDAHEDEVADWVDESDVSNYHTFTVPYGVHFHAKKIEKLCYTRDLLLNAEWNQPKERPVYLHRHPAFFGRVEDVIEDCCGMCPKPVTPEEIEVAEKEKEIYISGKVAFLIDNPGRQQIGSFNPLTENDWTDMAYIGNTARLCQSIVDGDVEDVLNWLSQEGSDPNKRDYTGRSPLHLAIMSSTPEIVRCLVDHGARITARLADGRTALHLAAERGNTEMITILMEKSIQNETEDDDRQARRKVAKFGGNIDGSGPAKSEKGDGGEDRDDENDSESDGELLEDVETDADQMSIATGSFVKVSKENEEGGADAVPDDPVDSPDFYKIDVLSWDIPCSPLHIAIAAGHEKAVSLLCEYGSDSMLPIKFINKERGPTGAILTLALALTLPLDKAKAMAKLLLKLGASSAQADINGCTAFHRYVSNAEPEMIDVLWDLDKTGVKAALNHLIVRDQYLNPQAVSPLHTAIGNGDTILVMKLLETGADHQIDFDSWLKAAKFTKRVGMRLGSYEENKTLFGRSVEQPLMVALRVCPDPELAFRLLQKGADPNSMTPVSYQILSDQWSRRYNTGATALDIVRKQLVELRKYTGEKCAATKPELPEGMDEHLRQFPENSYQHWLISDDITTKRKRHGELQKEYEKAVEKFEGLKGASEKSEAIREAILKMEKVEQLIIKKGKTFQDLHPDIEAPSQNNPTTTTEQKAAAKKKYEFNVIFYNATDITETRKPAYLELFEAAWASDLDKIKALTMQSWDEGHTEPPLKIAVKDHKGNHPMSLAFLRGHAEVARAILDIAKAQYVPEEKDNSRYRMETADDNEEDSDNSDPEDDDSDSEPRIVAEVVDKKFTIENIGQVSMQVKSRTRPLEMLLWNVPTFEMKKDQVVPEYSMTQENLFRFVMRNDDQAGLKALLDLGTRLSMQKLDGDEEDSTGVFEFPISEYLWAVQNGKTQMLAEIIKRTGAGIPLDHLVKKSGVEVKDKPRVYQGLTVYGKKRKDWANAGRNLVVKSTGMTEPPLLHAALEANIESVEWFLGDAPFRHYLEFGTSKAALVDPRLKHLSQVEGAFEKAVSKWLGAQNDLVIHCAVMSRPGEAANKLVKYLVQACPAAIEVKNADGETPLVTACRFGRVDFIKILVDAGADQSVRNKNGYNILHTALIGKPKAKQLRPLLELLDKDLLEHLSTTRSSLHDTGMTPLHAFVHGIPSSPRYIWQTHEYKKEKHWLETLALLLEFSGGAELEMLNGAGDTCLHTAVMVSNHVMVKALLDFKPKLLYRENAVGRTPLEVARDLIAADKFKEPRVISMPISNTSVTSLTTRPPDKFVEDEEDQGKGRAETDKERVWHICEQVLDQHPEKRRLVSLNEANDVAKRLGEQQNASRHFSVRRREDYFDHEEKEEITVDFSVGRRNARWESQWACPKCGKRHEDDDEENKEESERAGNEEDDDDDSDDS